MKKIILAFLLIVAVQSLAKETLYQDDYISNLKRVDHLIDTGIPNYIKPSALTRQRANVFRFEPIFFNGRTITASSRQTLEDIMHLISKKKPSSYYLSILGHSSSNRLPSHDIERSAWTDFWQKAGGEEMTQEQSIALVNSRLRTVYNHLKAEGFRTRNIYNENRTDGDLIATEESTKGINLNNRVDIALYMKGNINLRINFKLDSSIITSYYHPRVNAFARFLSENRDYKARIIGHTDKQAGYEYNIKLSNRRAMATKRLLISLGVKASQLRTTGKGYTQPIDRRSNKIAYRKNRRIEAQLIEP